MSDVQQRGISNNITFGNTMFANVQDVEYIPVPYFTQRHKVNEKIQKDWKEN